MNKIILSPKSKSYLIKISILILLLVFTVSSFVYVNSLPQETKNNISTALIKDVNLLENGGKSVQTSMPTISAVNATSAISATSTTASTPTAAVKTLTPTLTVNSFRNPGAPTVDYLKSDPLSYKSNDLSISYPTVTNFTSQVQAGRSVASYQYFNAPPISTPIYDSTESVPNIIPNSSELYLLDETGTFISFDKLDAPISYISYMDKVVREQTYKDFRISTTLSMAPNSDTVLVKINVKNLSSNPKSNMKLFLLNSSAAQVMDTGWSWSIPKINSNTNISKVGNAFVSTNDAKGFSAITTSIVPSNYSAFSTRQAFINKAKASSLDNQLVSPNKYTALQYNVSIGGGSTWSLGFAHTLSKDKAGAINASITNSNNIDNSINSLTTKWNSVLRDAFTRGNSTFSGYLPQMSSKDEGVTKLYYMSVATIIALRRTDPDSSYGTTYVTLAPEVGVTTTFFWDTAISSEILAQLDPAILKKIVEQAFQLGLDNTNIITYIKSSEFINNTNAYSSNRISVMQMAYNYIRFTGDTAWLDKVVNGKSIINHLDGIARYIQQKTDVDGLIFYGTNNQLLEVVPTYIDKVASLNAANVWICKKLAEIYSLRNNPARAAELKVQADKIAGAVLKLFNSQGYWNVKYKDGSLRPVPHIYDFSTVMTCMPEYLSQDQKQKMITYFNQEFKTTTWVRALSEKDLSSRDDSRTDHTDLGSYAGWPGLSLMGMYQSGFVNDANSLLGVPQKINPLTGKPVNKGILSITNQGVFGQAYWSGAGMGNLNVDGVAQKSSMGPALYLQPLRKHAFVSMSNEEISGGVFARVVTEGYFGVKGDLKGLLIANPGITAEDPDAYLYDYSYQGKRYVVYYSKLIPF